MSFRHALIDEATNEVITISDLEESGIPNWGKWVHVGDEPIGPGSHVYLPETNSFRVKEPHEFPKSMGKAQFMDMFATYELVDIESNANAIKPTKNQIKLRVLWKYIDSQGTLDLRNDMKVKEFLDLLVEMELISTDKKDKILA